MSVNWKGTKYKGVRYYEHPTRKHGVQKDRYYAIRYQNEGKRIEEGIGWASELDPKDQKHWTAEKAAILLAGLKEASKGVVSGPTRLGEKRKIENEIRDAEKAEQERLKREAIIFEDFFTKTYLPQAKADKKKRTVGREEGLFKIWLKPHLGRMPLKDISPVILEKLKKIMTDGKQSPRSVEYALAVVRQVFNFAKRMGVFEGESPTAKVKFPKPDNGRMRFLTPKEAARLLEALKVKSVDVHDMALLSLHCGLRRGEITSLTWQDVDVAKGLLTIRDAKAGSRYAFLTEQAAEMLKGRKKKKPTDFVFPNRKGGKVDCISHTFDRIVDELNLNEGIDDPRLQICFHSCRHSYASWMVEQGQDLYTVQKLLGHKTNVMTQRYAHLTENKLKDAARILSLAIKQRGTEEEK